MEFFISITSNAKVRKKFCNSYTYELMRYSLGSFSKVSLEFVCTYTVPLSDLITINQKISIYFDINSCI